MKSRIRIHKLQTRQVIPDVSTIPVQPMFQSRGFVEPKLHQLQSPPEDLKTKLMRAQRYGHSLSKMIPTEQPVPKKVPQVLQGKLCMGEPGDMYEQEADAVAAQVRERIHEGASGTHGQESAPEPAESEYNQQAFTTGQDVFFRQRKYNPGSRVGQELMAHKLTHMVQQNGGAVRRSPLPSPQLPQHTATETPFASAGDRLIQSKGEMTENSQVSSEEQRFNQTGLPDHLKTGIENLSGYSMDDVRVHYNSEKPAQLHAHAYAQGTDIHVASGQEKHLPHEAWHVVQQKQGRVKPTKQMKGGISINNDVGLEQEADLIGAKAAQKKTKAPQELKKVNPSLSTVQAIMSVPEFHALTPSKFLKRRRTITSIDQALNTYIQARTIVNAQNLINVINVYVMGNHDADRVAAANRLLNRAQAEHGLLQHIGNANAHLVDGLIEQATIARMAQLMQLAQDVTAAHATVLPNLINTVGAANINNLNMSNLVATIMPANVHLLPQLIPLAGGAAGFNSLSALITATGVPNVALLAPMITQSGGNAQIANLTTIINRHRGQGDLAFDLTREAGGNGATFARLAGEVPNFQQAAPPGGTPAGVMGAIGNYNAAIAPARTAGFQNLLNAAQAAHAAAPVGVAPGLVANVQARINAFNPILANTIGGAVPGANDMLAATHLRNIVNTALNNAVTGLGAPPPMFTNAVNNANAAYNALTAAQNPPTIASVNWDHFLTRHTSHYFNFGEIKPDNTQWNVGWGAGTANQVEAQLIAVLNALAGAGSWLMPGVPIPHQAVPAGGTAQIAGLAVAGGNQIRVGQFFPENSPLNNIYDHPDTTMRAIQKVI